ncbi:MAG TPA: hypothetical protein VGL99_14490 [Chloroflexota bacterium]
MPQGYGSADQWQRSHGELTSVLSGSGIDDAEVSTRDGATAMTDVPIAAEGGTEPPPVDTTAGPLEIQVASGNVWDLMHALYPGGVDALGKPIVTLDGNFLQSNVVNEAFPLLAEWPRRWSELTGRLHLLLVALTSTR